MTEPGPDPADRQAPDRQTRLNELSAAFRLLTRLPLPGTATEPSCTAAGAWAFPLVGACVGLLGGAAFLGANHAGLGIGSATLLAIGAQVLMTGALHEDGLADTADGFGGGRDREHKLAIMRDSRIGSYGAIALILSFGLRYAAINELANSLISTTDEYEQAVSHVSAVFIALVAAGAASRAAMSVAWYALPPARKDGLAVAAGMVPFRSAAIGVAMAAGIALSLLPVTAGTALLASVAVFTAAMAFLVSRNVGGYTGDTLGATQQIAEIAALLAITAATIGI